MNLNRNRFRGVLAALLLAAGSFQAGGQLVINELLAINDTGLKDQDGDCSDWIELYNAGSSNVNLLGWHLSDNSSKLEKWTFPSTNLPAGGYVVVFASGKNRAVAGKELHTSFSLNGDGEYLALVRPVGLVVEHAYAPEFPPQQSDVSFGLTTNTPDGVGYFMTPTPGRSNGAALIAQVADTKFSVDRGFYSNAFQVAITSATAGAEIRYTLNYGTPATNSLLYGGPLTITNTTVIRARAFKLGYLPSAADTHTYIFPDRIPVQSATPTGFPSTWGTTAADYAMDPNIVNDSAYSNQFPGALRALPSVSIVSDMSNLFDSAKGIYANPDQQGIAWERPASVEWMKTDGSKVFAANCGLRIYGGAFRGMGYTRKKSFRVFFKSDYGPSSISAPLFDENSPVPPTQDLDTFILRAGANDGWNNWGGIRTQYIADEFTRRSHLAMGRPSPHGCFVHVYLNGLYWGMYNAVEKAEETFGAAYFGGDTTNWDVMANGEAVQGNSTAWGAMVSMSSLAGADLAQYQKLQGNNPDRTPNPAYPNYLDVANYVDYLIVRMWIGDSDWPGNNWHAMRNRAADSTGFKFAVWDAEAGMDIWGTLLTDRTGDRGGVAQMCGGMEANAEFKLLFADRLQQHMFSGGALTTNQIIPRYRELGGVVDPAIVAESARWGDQGGARYTPVNWRAETNYLVSTYLPQRPDIVLQQFRSRGLYPAVAAPVFSRSAGLFPPGASLALTATNTIYYTMDGRDPRTYSTGTPAGTAYAGPITLDRSVQVKARARLSDGAWSALAQAVFVASNPPPLQVTELMFHPRPPEVGQTNFTAEDFEFIELRNAGSGPIGLAGVRITDGLEFDFTGGAITSLETGACVLVVSDLDGFKSRYDQWSSLAIAGEYTRRDNLPAKTLSNSGERVRILDGAGRELADFTYGGGRGWPASTQGAGHSLVPLAVDGQTNGVLDYGGCWRASAFIDGSPGRDDPEPVRDVVLNEIVAHTDTNAPPYDSNDQIELYNTTPAAVPLGSWYLSDDAAALRKWAIPATNVIGALGWRLFDEMHDFHNPITNGFGLSKGGEAVYLTCWPAGGPARVADAIRFKGQPNGLSLGRFPDGNESWLTMPLTPGGSNGEPPPHVVISELMVQPPALTNGADNTRDEYIELYNPTAQEVLLSTEAGGWRIDGGVGYAFPTNLSIGAGQTLLVVSFDPATDTVARAAFCGTYGLTNFSPAMVGPFSGKLSDSSDRVALEKPQFGDLPGEPVSWIIVDEVIYSMHPPWPQGAAGTGLPLDRIPGAGDGNDPANWRIPLRPTPAFGPVKLALTQPEYGREYLIPFTCPLRAEVDPYQVSGSVHRVEFCEGTNLIAVDTAPPFTAEYTSHGAAGQLSFTARLWDDGGSCTSAVSVVQAVGPMVLTDRGATDIGEFTASVQGELGGLDRAAVTVYWGVADGGSNALAWDHSAGIASAPAGGFVIPVDHLGAGVRFFYRLCGARAQGTVWTPVADFEVPGYERWNNAAKLSFDGYAGSSTLTNIPVLVVLGTNMPGFAYSQLASPVGDDLRFTDAANRPLSYEIERWQTNGLSHLWVRVAELAPGSFIRMFWGCPGATKPAWTLDGSTWSAGYRAVWHLAGNGADATGNGLALTRGGDAAFGAGLAGQGGVFDGDMDYFAPSLGAAWYGSNSGNLTLFACANVAAGAPALATVFGGDDGTAGRMLGLRRGGFRNLYWQYAVQSQYVAPAVFTWQTGQWVVLSCVLQGGVATGYRNGVPGGSTNYTSFTPSSDPWIGHLSGQTTNLFSFKGQIDEVRVSGVARSADWVLAESQSILNAGSFIRFESIQPADVDSDGLPDAWELHYFGRPDVASGTTDSDGDGMSDAEEYVAGTCPTLPDGFCLDYSLSNGDFVVSLFGRFAPTNWYGPRARFYRLESTESLSPAEWSVLPGCSNVPGADRAIEYTNDLPAASLFYRARVWLE